MWRHGVTKSGTERYFCPDCIKTSIIHRPDTRLRHDKDRFVAWLTGVESKNAVAKHYGVTRRALSKEFEPFFQESFDVEIPQNFKAKILIVDAKFIHGRELCALIALAEDDQIIWQFANAECYQTWRDFLSLFSPPEVVVADGQKGVALFVRRYWPKTAFQRCHFHMVSLIIHYLSRNPKDEAGQEILELMYRLKQVKTLEERDKWKLLYRIWEKQYEKVFNEKSESGGYVHRKLRSVRFIVRRAIPNLFTYLDHPGCPNTTNLVEGWVNAAIAEGLRRHRGLHLSQKKTLVSIILSNLKRSKREKPTRKFSEKPTPKFP